MKKILLPLITLVCFTAHGQLKRISFSVSPNATVIKSTQETIDIWRQDSHGVKTTEYLIIDESSKNRTGINVSVQADIMVSKKLFISTGLATSYLRYERNFDFTTRFGDGAGAPVIIMPRSDRTALFINVPLLMGTSFLHDKLLIKAGPTFSHLTSATYYTLNFNNFKNEKQHDTKGLNTLLINATIDIAYMITPSFGINFDYQKSFAPIYKIDERIGGKTYYNILSLGLNYTLPVRKKDNK